MHVVHLLFQHWIGLSKRIRMRSCFFYVSPVLPEQVKIVNEELDLQITAVKSFVAHKSHTLNIDRRFNVSRPTTVRG